MGILPCDIKYTRLIIAGWSLDCIVETIAIAAIQSVDRDLFMSKNQFKCLHWKLEKRFDYNHELKKDYDPTIYNMTAMLNEQDV